ncbi:hypothetical protein CDL15_Pgr023953 [Punica granatum]|uniref:Uncharacterized protein n=1 Tax=Punica granatum TaxID=22663 RepID=A0A218WVN6_PUNGR|nr:hypothetical protein CDL15_Pgr023953 [Punica granatum]
MDGGKEGGGEEEESVREVLRDRLRLSSISIAQSQALRDGMEVSEPVLACIADLSFKYAEQLAINVEQFARHAGRKYVNMEDVILSGDSYFIRLLSLATSLCIFMLFMFFGPSLTSSHEVPQIAFWFGWSSWFMFLVSFLSQRIGMSS